MKGLGALIKQKPLTKNEVRQAVIITIKDGYVDNVGLCRKLKIGFGRADQLAKLMYASGIIVDSSLRGTVVILRDEAQAINAALRHLKKGKK